MLHVLGITGSIGCGKSTVVRLFEALGARSCDADRLARDVLAPGSPVLLRVVERFGHDLLLGDGPPATRNLDRRLLAERIFASADQRRQLEAIVHPHVFAAMAQHLAAWDRQTPEARISVVVLEIPLLFETHAESLCDTIAVVACGAQQAERLASRPGMTPRLQQQIIDQQWPEIDKCRQAHWIIDNRQTHDRLVSQVGRIWENLHHTPCLDESAWPQRWQRFLETMAR